MFSFWNHWNVDDDLEIWLVSLGSTISWFSSDIFCKTRHVEPGIELFLPMYNFYWRVYRLKKLFNFINYLFYQEYVTLIFENMSEQEF